ncbi:hypothetical protein [Pseudomonas phage vB_Pa-PAC1]
MRARSCGDRAVTVAEGTGTSRPLARSKAARKKPTITPTESTPQPISQDIFVTPSLIVIVIRFVIRFVVNVRLRIRIFARPRFVKLVGDCVQAFWKVFIIDFFAVDKVRRFARVAFFRVTIFGRAANVSGRIRYAIFARQNATVGHFEFGCYVVCGHCRYSLVRSTYEEVYDSFEATSSLFRKLKQRRSRRPFADAYVTRRAFAVQQPITRLRYDETAFRTRDAAGFVYQFFVGLFHSSPLIKCG